MHLPLWISCPAALTVSMSVCSSCIPVPVLFLNRKLVRHLSLYSPGRQRWARLEGTVVLRSLWSWEWKIPLSLPSCHQLALLSEGRLHCFLFTQNLDPWLIPFACHCVDALYRTASAFLRSTRRDLLESRHDNFCLRLMSEARGDWPNIHVHQCLWMCACESVSVRMWA